MKGKIAIIADEFALDTPTQHLLDRFLIGFQSDGVFHDAPRGRVTAYVTNPDSPLIKKRRDVYGLKLAPTPSAAVQDADGVLIVTTDQAIANEALNSIGEETPVYTYGLPSVASGKIAKERKFPFEFGTEISLALHLPALKLPTNLQLSEGLIVSSSEIFAFDLLRSTFRILPHSIRFIEGPAIWEAGEHDEWSWPLLRAAISRTDKAQGNTVLDGRTEDIARLGLIRSMAKSPRGWLIRSYNNERFALLDLNGVVADILVALRGGLFGTNIQSAQIFQSPAPQREEFSRLTKSILAYFAKGDRLRREVRTDKYTVLDIFSRMASIRDGQWHLFGGTP